MLVIVLARQRLGPRKRILFIDRHRPVRYRDLLLYAYTARRLGILNDLIGRNQVRFIILYHPADIGLIHVIV